eukprot:5240220-Lingulodinium_polyedra.AAC.1
MKWAETSAMPIEIDGSVRLATPTRRSHLSSGSSSSALSSSSASSPPRTKIKRQEKVGPPVSGSSASE